MYFTDTDPIARLLGTWSSDITIYSIILRLLLSLLLSALIGCERSNKRHSAGLRTFILACVGATLAVIADNYLIRTTQDSLPLLSAATIIAVAIIATSSILYSSKSQIKGLTTATALWATSVVGLALGAGYYTSALAGFLTIFFCLSVLPKLEKYLKDRSNHFEIHLELTDRYRLQDFITTLRKLGMLIDDIESNPAYANSGLAVYSISLTITKAELKKYQSHKEIIDALATLDYVSHIEEI
ncbi:MAG: MgtC/SapB family protein [Lachnospiraceae bacterium]|nr:MgtC/SapB family protein [Lachnospiraceae bacterium]MBQ9563121.1 MgtC/SapB family protein [Lachnospiraceae bacterium]MBQ9592675.1 MgtC/SapB family protein [Lachnospiraceae bacterium]MBR0153491.1 MgtC/SapB family protein [Lachnospiraceae bacterium]